MMLATNAGSTATFVVKPQEHYFTDEQTIRLLQAALAGDLDTAKQLVIQGADPNTEGPKDNKYNRIRILHYAIAVSSSDGVRTLMAVGADPEFKARGFGNALSFAMTLDKVQMLDLMLNLRPVSTLSAETIDTLMTASVTMPRPQCLDLLLQHGVPLDFKDETGYTVLMSAMDTQDYDLAEWLILRGASVVIQTNYGITPANIAELHLKKFKPGTPEYNKVLHLKDMMAERGAVFPAPTPAQIRAKRAF